MDNGNEKKLTIRLVCVLLSFGLWLYVTNVENPTRKSDIRDVPVELVNTSALANSNLALAPNQKFTVDLTIEGPATEIYTVNKEEFKLKADIGSYALKKGDNNIPVQVVNYPQGIYIKNNGVLAVKVKIEDLIEKEVKVESKVKTTYKEGFSQASSKISPEKVKVSGPSSAVEKITSVALVGELKDIDKDIEDNFDLKAFDNNGTEVDGVEISETKGTLSLKIGKGKEVPIKPSYTGKLKDGLSIESAELSRNKINVIGDTSKIEKLDFLELEPVDLSAVTGSKDFNLKIILPEGISISKGEEYVTLKLKIANKITVTKVFDGIPINYIGEDSNKFKYDKPTAATVTLSGTESDLQSITADNIRLEATLTDLIEGEHSIVLKSMLLNTNNRNISIQSNSGPIKVIITKR